MTGKKTTLQLTEETKKRLDKIGHKGETYDDILSRLLDHQEKRSKK